MAIPEVPVAEANQVYFKAPSTAPISATSNNGESAKVNVPPSWIPGPIVNGCETRLYNFQPDQLLRSPIWPSFQDTINRAYDVSHQTHHILGSKPRVAQTSEYLSAIGGGTGDEAFTLVCTMGDQVISTVSAHAYTAPDLTKGGLHPMMRDRLPEVENDAVSRIYWEVKLLAVHPDFQRRGLAGTMLRETEEEITRRFKTTRKDGEKLVILLSTIREINFGVYINRGYVVDYDSKKPAGTLKSERAFTLTHFSKKIPLDE